MLEHIVADLVDRVERRFYGKYRGFVVSNQDPARLGRVRVRVPSVLGEDVVTGWATPCAPAGGLAGLGLLFVPERDSGVWVEFEEGDLEFPIWTGTFWTKNDTGSGIPRPAKNDGHAEDDVQETPTRKIITTTKGHTLQFEDADGEEMLLISEGVHHHVLRMDAKGVALTDGDGSTIEMSDEGITVKDTYGNQIVLRDAGIHLEDVKGSTVEMGDKDITVKDAHGNQIALREQGVRLEDVTGNALDMGTQKVTLTSKVPFTIDAAGQPVKIVADAIALEKG